MENNRVYVYERLESYYPTKDESFNPSFEYPEYNFINEISNETNHVYDMLRESLYSLEFDKKNYGTKNWNPLKEIISPGDTVLVKPNMVMDKNAIEDNGMECLITHPSLVRATIDYVILALKGKGKIILGDAPMQSCNFERLIEQQGYNSILNFYKNKNIDIQLIDFRNYKTEEKDGILQKVKSEQMNNSIAVDLGENSEFYGVSSKRMENLRITNYDHSIMPKHHNLTKHEYLIAKYILDADVIINMPKPKTHRKAGVTLSLKNLVGINTNKECLPHHTKGSINEGGDEYLTKSLLKKNRTVFIEKKDSYMVEGKYNQANLVKNISRGFSLLDNILNKERYLEGSWYGNDTIWRTILDLNKITFYANKNGEIKEDIQRKMLIIGDMIVSGEGEGPLLPTPKKVGIIAVGTNPVAFDESISAIMGLNKPLVKSIYNARLIKKFTYHNEKETLILSNNIEYNSKQPREILFESSKKFLPSKGWKDYFIQK